MTSLHLTKHHELATTPGRVHPDSRDLASLAQRLCDRRRGIGADGLLVAESHEGYAARMTLYNADGSLRGDERQRDPLLRSSAWDRRGELSDQLILTDAGDRLVVLEATDDPATITARVEMGDVTVSTSPTAGLPWGATPIGRSHI